MASEKMIELELFEANSFAGISSAIPDTHRFYHPGRSDYID
jgi:hypothetical protein